MHTMLIVSITFTNLHKSLDIGMVTVLQLWSCAIDDNSIIGGHAQIHACVTGKSVLNTDDNQLSAKHV